MFIKSFYDGEKEVRPECVCHFVLPAGKIGHISSGVVDIDPGGRSFSCAHTAWRQVFFILEGKGKIVLDAKDEMPVEKDMVVEIPYDCEHKVVADESGPLRYLFINDYGRPVLKDEKEATKAHDAIDPECQADLQRGESIMKEPPPPMPEDKK